MRVLIACESFGKVRRAFRRLGHDAVSCDIIPDSEGETRYHIQTDIKDLLASDSSWDLMIAFPPCTHLAVSGARWFKDKKEEQIEALSFVSFLLDQDIPRIALENPVSVISTKIRKPDQIIHPWMFGHGETKKTCLWLKNLPHLVPTNIVEGRTPRIHYMSPSKERAVLRSITYDGIAKAMAEQWQNPLHAT